MSATIYIIDFLNKKGKFIILMRTISFKAKFRRIELPKKKLTSVNYNTKRKYKLTSELHFDEHISQTHSSAINIIHNVFCTAYRKKKSSKLNCGTLISLDTTPPPPSSLNFGLLEPHLNTKYIRHKKHNVCIFF